MTMAGRRHGLLLLSVLAISACATIPSGPPQGAGEAALREAIRRNQEDAARLEREGRLRESLERWKIVSAIDPQNTGASQKQRDLQAKIQEQAQQRVAGGRDRLRRKDKEAAQRDFLATLRLDPLNREAIEQLYQSEQQLGEQTAFARPLRKGASPAKAEPGQSGGEAKSPTKEEAEEDEESGEEVSLAEAAELFRKGDYLSAIEAFNRVLVQQPGLREAVEYQKLAYYNQGLVYMKGENYAEALKMLERVRRIQPDFKRLPQEMQTAREKLAEQHNVAGIRHFKQQKLKEAIDEWDHALALNPKLESAKRSQERAKRLLKSLEEIER